MTKDQIVDLAIAHFWIVGLLVTLAHYLGFRVRAREEMASDPRLREGYQRLLKGYLRWFIPPWIIMAVGQVVGGRSALDYVIPDQQDPYVMIWFGAVFTLWAWGGIWLFFRGGAALLARHPGALPSAAVVSTAAGIRLWWIILTAMGAMLLVMLWNQWAPGM